MLYRKPYAAYPRRSTSIRHGVAIYNGIAIIPWRTWNLL